MSFTTKVPCSKCGRETLLTYPYGVTLRVCTKCHKIEEVCKCASIAMT